MNEKDRLARLIEISKKIENYRHENNSPEVRCFEAKATKQYSTTDLEIPSGVEKHNFCYGL